MLRTQPLLSTITLGIGLAISSTSTLAATNPVTYSLSPSTGLPTPTYVGSSYSVQYTLANQLPFTVTIKGIDHTVSNATLTLHDNCSNKTLAARGSSGSTCIVTAAFRPSSAGSASMQLSMHYDNNVVPMPTLSTTAQSGSTEEITGNVTSPLPGDTETSVTYPVTFQFTNKGNTSVTASSVSVTGDTGYFTQTSNNCADPITPTNNCKIIGNFVATTSGNFSLTSQYNYDSGSKSVTLHTSTHTSQGGTGCASVDGSLPLELPSQTYTYADNVVEFKFTNHCDSAAATLGAVQLSTGSTMNSKGSHTASVLTKGEDNCSNATLAADASCTILASLVPGSTTGPTYVKAVVDYTESNQSKTSTITTTSTVNANTTSNRMITVVNQCPFPVWMTFNPGSYGPSGCSASPTPTYTCPTGTTCNSSAAAGDGLCYWSNPTTGVTQDGKLLAAAANQAPSTMNILIPESNGGSATGGVIYNAGIMPRLGCSGTGSSVSCKVNTCTTGSDGLCLPGDGPSTTPVAFNAVEFTFNRTGGDGVYNNQIIDGITVPLEMKGRGPISTGTAPYDSCSATGAIIQPTASSSSAQLGACTFDFDPSSSAAPGDNTDYRYVYLSNPTSPTYCDSNSDCTVSGEICGLGYDSGGKIDKACGLLEGYNSVNKGICSQGSSGAFGRSKSLLSPNFGTSLYTTIFNCDKEYSSTAGTYKNSNLYACSGSIMSQSSCYNGSTPCCGCIDWWTASGGSLAVPSDTVSCNNVTNVNWNNTAQSTFQWVKSACPTSYVYQFDDKSSSFTCSVKQNTQVVTNYQVTFCPGGKTVSTITP